jgi:hypothetical protein
LLEYLRDASLVLLKHKPKTQTVVYQTDHWMVFQEIFKP